MLNPVIFCYCIYYDFLWIYSTGRILICLKYHAFPQSHLSAFFFTYLYAFMCNVGQLCQNYKIPSQNRKTLSSLQVARCIDALSIRYFRIRSEALHKTLQLPSWVRYEICTIWKSCKIFWKLFWYNLPFICCVVFGFPTWHPQLINFQYFFVSFVFLLFTFLFLSYLWNML